VAHCAEARVLEGGGGAVARLLGRPPGTARAPASEGCLPRREKVDPIQRARAVPVRAGGSGVAGYQNRRPRRKPCQRQGAGQPRASRETVVSREVSAVELEQRRYAALRHGARSERQIVRRATVEKRRLLRQIGLRQNDLVSVGQALLLNWSRAAAALQLMD